MRFRTHFAARDLTMESLERRELLAADFVISEFMASNDNGLRDQDQNRSDWIEILNVGSDRGSFDGWFLTDDPNDLDKWKLPDVELHANERTVVFASEKNRRAPNDELHTNFRLGSNSEYLALVRPDGVTVAFDFAPEFPPQIEDLSFGIPQPVSKTEAVDAETTMMVLIPTTGNGGDVLQQSWTEVQFDDLAWQPATGGIGYERESGYEDLIATDLGDAMFNVNASAFVRIPFSLQDAASVYSMTLSMQYEDGYVAYINGREVARRNAPEELRWDSQATGVHRDQEAINPEFAEIDISQVRDVLRTGENVLAIHALNDKIDSSDFLLVPRLDVDSFGELQTDSRQFFDAPSPGLPNGLGTTTSIVEVSHSPNVPKEGEPLLVNATLVSTSEDVTSVSLHYRLMFEAESTIPMFDDGQHGDGAANDNVFGATLPRNLASRGQMIRYRVTAGDTARSSTRSPLFTDPISTREYYGTVVEDPSIESNLPVIHWFLEDPAGADSQAGTRGALFHHGRFYDNIEIDTSGRTVGLAGPKKSHDVFFTSDNWFELGDTGLRMNDFDLISDFWNRAKVRVPMGYTTFTKMGTPSHLSMPVRIQENGEFYATYSFVDGGNEQFLDRAGLDPGGALYKMNLGFSTGRGTSKKQTRTYEDNTDLREFFAGLALSGEERVQFLMDHVNMPASVNFLVGLVTMGHGDCCGKNLYLYRDTEGTGEWEMLPWDVDSAFGRGGVGVVGELFPNAGGLFSGRDNPLIAALFDEVPGFRDMYLRRLRTVLDDLLQSTETPAEELKFENWIDELVEQLGPDVPLDFEKWGSWYADPENERVIFASEGVPTWEESIALLKNEYFPTRRRTLYRAIDAANGSELLSQTSAPEIRFGQIDFNPISGNQDEEYIALTNPNDVSVDISGWRIEGGVDHTLDPGTVIPAAGTLYLSPNVNAFRARQTGPTGGQGLFIQGNYVGHISNHGATIRLTASDGSLVAETTTASQLTPAQQFLRVSEIMYHPRDAAEGSRFTADDYEFIELVNTSRDQAIDLTNVAIRDAIEFVFPAMNLAAGERVVIASDRDAFEDRYPVNATLVGEYGRTNRSFRLANGGETVRLEIASGDLIHEFTYDDVWHGETDGLGKSLVIVDATAEVDRWNTRSGWRSSQSDDGSPGTEERDGDLNSDGVMNVADIDLLCAAIHANDLAFDLNSDSRMNQRDLAILVQDLIGTDFGDANLDGVFNSADLVLVFQSGEYEDQTSGNSNWADGDWNCDGEFGSADLVVAFQSNGFDANVVTSDSTTAARRAIARSINDDILKERSQIRK